MAARLLLALGVALGALAPPEAASAGAPAIRVLLGERPAPLRVDGPAGATWLERTPGGLRTRGGGERPLWRSPGDGPHDVDGLRVRGALEVRPGAAGGLAVVNELPLESYVAATLGSESYASWEPAALRAQAVAIRTYALHRRAARRAAGALWDVEAGTRSQVYGGVPAESEPVWDAVRATRGQVLVYRGRPILAAYHSASGGRTASAEEVWGDRVAYLTGREVEGEDDSPDTYWRVRIAPEALRLALAERGRDPGAVREVRVQERGPSGRVRALVVRGSRGDVRLTGRELRSALGERTLRSTLFEVRTAADAGERGDDWVFVGSGNGHGVGMSQWGARALAARGHDHASILTRFYPGARLVPLRGARLGLLETAGGARRTEVAP